MKGILEGLRIIDTSTVLAGPLIASLLGDFGAEVIKIEQPVVGDSTRHIPSEMWKVSNRNKKCITLDFHKKEAVDLFYRLTEKSDAVVLNFRPQTLGRWKIDYNDLVKVKENIIVIHLSAFGRNGPYAQRPGFARVAEAFSGLTYITGYPDTAPIFCGYPIADGLGGVYGAFSLMLALYHLKLSGEGQLIDLALYEPLFRIMEDYIIDYNIFGRVKNRVGNYNPAIAPNDMYKTGDEQWVVIPASTQNIFERLMYAIDHPELVEDERFITNGKRLLHRKELDRYLIDYFSRRDLQEIVKALEKHEVAYGTVNSVKDIYADPQVKERENIISVYDPSLKKEISMQGVVPKFSRTPGEVKWVGPDLGAHNMDVYGDILGLPEGEIRKLTEKGVI